MCVYVYERDVVPMCVIERDCVCISVFLISLSVSAQNCGHAVAPALCVSLCVLNTEK